jgi:hypothetical protein
MERFAMNNRRYLHFAGITLFLLVFSATTFAKSNWLLIGLAPPPTAFMQQGGPYTITPSVIPGGGKTSSNAITRISSTIGQPLNSTSTGGSFQLNSGFWPAAVLCLSLSKSSQSFNASAGIGTVNVSGLASCAWTAVSNDPSFITITSGASGSGDGIVTYSVTANTSTSSRAGTITIANQSHRVLQGAAFLDVPPTHPFYDVIGKLSASGITSGCGGGNFCPDAIVTREQMAAFIIKAVGILNPPTPGAQRFNDVPPTNIFYAFIEQMAVLQITLGCSSAPPLYCPSDVVSREQMAAFIIKALHEPGYVPPTPGSQRFNDVPPSNIFYGHIEEMAVRGITAGCSASPPLYCPGQSVTRAQMAAFLVRAFNL